MYIENCIMGYYSIVVWLHMATYGAEVSNFRSDTQITAEIMQTYDLEKFTTARSLNSNSSL